MKKHGFYMENKDRKKSDDDEIWESKAQTQSKIRTLRNKLIGREATAYEYLNIVVC